jgi:hypothetical protein
LVPLRVIDQLDATGSGSNSSKRKEGKDHQERTSTVRLAALEFNGYVATAVFEVSGSRDLGGEEDTVQYKIYRFLY